MSSHFLLPIFCCLYITGCVQTKQYKNSQHLEIYDEKKEYLSENILIEDFNSCAHGKKQSPIHILTSDLKTNESLPKIFINYHSSPLIIKNNQHTIKAKFDKTNSIMLGNKKYSLIQFHLHAPSEHKIDGKFSDLELHLVHQSESGEYAVMAILMNTGKENFALKQFFENLPKEDHAILNTNLKINLNDILPSDLSYYSYFGSLTTFPCDEKVNWLVLKNGVEVSEEQIQNFKTIFPNNAREIQPLNNRVVETNLSN
ncbi:carbonic anhydrase [Fluviispira vulneris]|uniref:carbonic anhydrase n=1 Tax=Fluviispira vulneris TaxID=2763012 RepID=UPI0016459721|nr:carbonic anhydrase family protein [Fluviispira vulneris]